MKIAFVFPGQGSQSIGMMDDWIKVPIVRNTIKKASSLLNQNLEFLISYGPLELLNLTENTQPIMLAMGIALFRAWQEFGGPIPDIIAGHSLGEYTALTISDSLSFEDSIHLVRNRANIIQKFIPVGIGAMAAILGLNYNVVESICHENSLGDIVEIANFNTTEQIIISGHKTAVDRVSKAAKLAGAKRSFLLPISAPFHSRILEPISEDFSIVLDKIIIKEPKIDIINNVDVSILKSPIAIRDSLIRQIWNPVRWIETIKYMKKLGITHIVECGPGNILTGLIKRIDNSLKIMNINNPDSLKETLTIIGNKS